MSKVLIGIIILLIIGQFIQPPHNNGTAEASTDITHVVAVPDTIQQLLKTSCYDCHSNHTTYPWYSKITPVNWWLNSHIQDGKKQLNFSEFANGTFKRKHKKLEATAKEVKEHDMPLSSYLWIHKNSRLNDAQRKMLIDWTEDARKQVLADSLQAKR
ncbi:MAG: heme-binding domain-containing protein [Flavisolibacter sp.]